MILPHNGFGAAAQPLEPRLLFAKPFGTYYTDFGSPFTPGRTSISTDSEEPAPVNPLTADRFGNLYVGGGTQTARVTAAGVLDADFGVEGLATLPGNATFIAQATEPHGRLYVVFHAAAGTMLARYTRTGRLDRTFGQGGLSLVTADPRFTATAVAVAATSQPVIAGTEATHDRIGAAARVFRFNLDGSLDTAFGSGGSRSAQLGLPTPTTPNLRDIVTGVEALPNGEILVGGGSFSFAVTASGDTFGPASFAAAKFTAAGRLDPAYGDHGIARAEFASSKQLRIDRVFTPQDISLPGFDSRPDGSAVFGGVEAEDLPEVYSSRPRDFIANFDASGVATYSTTWTPNLTAVAGDHFVVRGIVAMSGGRATVLTLSTQYGPAAVTSISSSGAIGQTVTTFNKSYNTVNLGSDVAMMIAPNGKLFLAGVGANFEELLELNQGSGFVPAFDGFSDATTSSLATFYVESDGGIHADFTDVVYYSPAADCLMFAEQRGNGIWTKPTPIPSTTGVKQSFSLQIREVRGVDALDPYVAFYDPRSKSLKLARSLDSGQSFKVVTLDASGDAGEFASLLFNPETNLPEVYYDDRAHQQVKFATENSEGKWVISVIDSGVQVGDQSAAVQNSLRLPVFAYLDRATGQIKLAQRDIYGQWDIAVAATVKKGVRGLSVNPYGNFIAYFDDARNELRDTVLVYDDTSIHYTTYTAAVGGGPPINDVQISSDSQIFAYDAASDSVSSYSYMSPPDPETIVTHGGAYLQAADEYAGGTLLAFLDSRSGKLVFRIAS